MKNVSIHKLKNELIAGSLPQGCTTENGILIVFVDRVSPYGLFKLRAQLTPV
jgi:hypothetical protein